MRNRGAIALIVGVLDAITGSVIHRGRVAAEQRRARRWQQDQRQQDERRAPGARERSAGSPCSAEREDLDRDVRHRMAANGFSWYLVGLKMPSRISSGAVSPAARAIARIVPVMIPRRRVRQQIPVIERQRLDPERVRSLAQRRRHEQQHLLAGARDQRQHDDRQCQRGRRSPIWPVPSTTQPEDHDADDDASEAPASVSSASPERARAPRGGRANSARYSATGARAGLAIIAANATIMIVPMIAEPIPPPAPQLRRVLIRNAGLSERPPRTMTARATRPEHCHREPRRQPWPRSRHSRLTAWRRRRLPEAASGAVGSNRGTQMVEPPVRHRTGGRSTAREQVGRTARSRAGSAPGRTATRCEGWTYPDN